MKLSEYLDFYGITYREFANLAKVDYTSFSGYLNGDHTPSLEAAIRIVNASEGLITYEELVSEKREKPN